MTAPQSEAASSALANPGETLRAARESKNWSLSSVAQQLNLSERSLTQIEAGDFSQMPGHTFARGYVRAYAKLLGLDQARLVQQFDHHTGTDATGSRVNSLGYIDQPVRLSRSMVRFFTFLLTIVIAVGAFLWWQDRTARNESGRSVSALERIEVEAADGTTEIHLLDRAEEPEEPAADAADPEHSLPEPTEAPAPATESQVTIEQTLGQPNAAAPVEQSATADPAAPTEAAIAPEPVPVTPAETEAPAAETAQSAQTEVAQGEGQLSLVYNADCWTRVTDADGNVLYSALARAGTSRTVTGKVPLDVHLGFASGVEVRFNGEAVDLSGKTRGETARFKLGQ